MPSPLLLVDIIGTAANFRGKYSAGIRNALLSPEARGGPNASQRLKAFSYVFVCERRLEQRYAKLKGGDIRGVRKLVSTGTKGRGARGMEMTTAPHQVEAQSAISPSGLSCRRG